jgi:hypothetical protein
MCDPNEPFDFPDLPDEAVIAIETFLEDFYNRFQTRYFDQIHQHYQDRPQADADIGETTLTDPPF